MDDQAKRQTRARKSPREIGGVISVSQLSLAGLGPSSPRGRGG